MISIKSSKEINHIREAIFPIFRIDSDNRYFLVGTGFFVGDEGVFVTAKHVVEECLGSGQDMVVLHFTKNSWVMRNLDIHTPHEMADVSVGTVELIKFKSDGKLLENVSLKISPGKPKKEEMLYTYAYPKTEISYNEEQEINVIPTNYNGCVVEEFPNGRDRVLLPSACYQVDMAIIGGASGGPVFNSEGYVVGINSTSLEGESITYISCISDALGLTVYNDKPLAELICSH